MKHIIRGLLLVVMAGCAKKVPALEGAVEPPPPPEAPVTQPDSDAPATAEVARGMTRLARVYFEFDKSRITPDARDTLTENAAILREAADVSIEIQGHCDERGSTEYNQALGDRRARSVMAFLVRLGIDEHRVTTISYGEEVPLEEGSGEEIWGKNRRAEFRVTSGSSVIGTVD